MHQFEDLYSKIHCNCYAPVNTAGQFVYKKGEFPPLALRRSI